MKRIAITLTMAIELDTTGVVHGQVNTGAIMIAVEKEMARHNPKVTHIISNVTESTSNLHLTKGAPNV